MKKILITGANGFVGSALSAQLEQKKSYTILKVTRSGSGYAELGIDFSADFNVQGDLADIDVVVHCAARVHLMNDNVAEPLTEFRKINRDATLKLAQQAANAGVKRFIFLSSIKVNGEFTEPGKPFKPGLVYIPTDPYGLSKYEAELELQNIAKKTNMEVVIIRPPLVYGPGVKANFATMMKWVKKGIPLPLGGIKDNRRSLVSVDNLIDLITICIEHPKAANQTFLISDDQDLSTAQLLADMSTALNVPNRLLPVPACWLVWAAKLIARPAIAQRLCGSLQVDISKTKEVLNWQPPYSTAECMKKTADAFLKDNNN